MSRVPLCVAGGIFAFGALVHISRYITHFHLAVGTYEVPVVMNVIGAVLFGALSVWMFYAAIRERS